MKYIKKRKGKKTKKTRLGYGIKTKKRKISKDIGGMYK